MTKKGVLLCFGVVDNVFLVANDSLRFIPEICIFCSLKVDCLKIIMKSDKGLKIAEKATNDAFLSDSLNFFQRWTKKKFLSRFKEKVNF